jgi:probable HAF family extracellular repeat protein
MNSAYRSELRASGHDAIPWLCAVALLAALVSPGTMAAGPKHAPAVPDYPRYRLIDLGTLGGPNASTTFPAVALNNRGQVIAFASTATLDSNPFTIQDEFIWHGILSDGTGVVRDLGALPGTNQSLASGISANGLITGFSENGLLDPLTGFPQLRAVLWDSSLRITDLGTLGGNVSVADQVNSRGQVVGSASNGTPENPDIASFFLGVPAAAQQARAFLWEKSSMRDLGTLGGNNAHATLINERGDVTGASSTGVEINDSTGLPTTHPFLWRDGQMRDLGSLGGTLATPGSFAFGPWGQVMNDLGQVAGTSMLPGDENWHAFFWSSATGMIDLGTFGGSRSEAVSISNRGEVLGRAVVTDTPLERHAFLWEKGSMTDLGVVAPCHRSTAESINSRGQIVGGLGACTDNSDDLTFFRAFYVEKGKPMVDLNTLIEPPSDLLLEDAHFINERGEIVAGAFTPTGETRVVLLVPLAGH